MIYVSHRLDEVLAIADRITVLRDGETRATLDAKEASKAKLIELMIGREALDAASSACADATAPIALKVEDLSADGLQDISLRAAAAARSSASRASPAPGPERLTRALTSTAPAA